MLLLMSWQVLLDKIATLGALHLCSFGNSCPLRQHKRSLHDGNLVHHCCTKYIKIDIHFFREKGSTGTDRVLYVPLTY
jgi:hypothetical protein